MVIQIYNTRLVLIFIIKLIHNYEHSGIIMIILIEYDYSNIRNNNYILIYND